MALPNDIIKRLGGMESQANELVNGGISFAENVVVERDGVIERRRGFANYSSNFPAAQPAQMFVSGGVLFAHTGTSLLFYDTVQAQWHEVGGTHLPRFGVVVGLWGNSTHLYMADNTSHVIVRLVRSTNKLELFAGYPGTSGTANGTATAARFNGPANIWGDATNLYVADSGNHSIRKIVLATAVVTTFAGLNGTSGTSNGTGSAARFNSPFGVWGDATNLYVADQNNSTIRKIVLATAVVTTWAGTAGASAGTDGTGTDARFRSPGNVWGNATNLYVSDVAGMTIRKIVLATAVVTTWAGTDLADGSTDDTGTAARFYYPGGLWGTATDLYVSDFGNHTIRKIVLATAVVTTWAGSAGVSGTTDATGGSARFNATRGLWADSSDLYIADAANLLLRKGVLSSAVITTHAGKVGATAAEVLSALILGSISPSTGYRLRSAEMRGNVFVSGSVGTIAVESSSTSRPAGLPRPLDISSAAADETSSTGGILKHPSGNSAETDTVGYRLVYGLRDSNDNLLIGAPSNIVIHQFSAADKVPNVVTFLPIEITTSHFYQLYRTAVALAGADPGSNFKLVKEDYITAAQVAAGQMTITDSCPDAARGASLYTNDSEEGIANQNDRPPLCRDLCEFRGHLLAAYPTDKHTLMLHLIGLPTANDTVVIAGVTYTAKASETIASGEFAIGATGNTSQKIRDTAQSLVRVINRYASNTAVYAYYVSSDAGDQSGFPGLMQIEERTIGGSAFSATASAGSKFSPILPTSGTAVTSVAEERANVVRVSKPDEPEAMPIYRNIYVGSESDAIERIIPLRDSVIVVKASTVWRIVGSSFEDMTAVLLDDTTSCAGRDSYVKLNNNVIGLSSQGFVAISDNGVKLIGRPEEHRVLASLAYLQSPDHATLVAGTSEQQRIYVCTLKDAQTTQHTTYCWNAITNTWTRWRVAANCWATLGDRLHYGLANALGHVLRQKATLVDGGTGTYQDYSDDSGTFTVSSVDSTAKTVTGTFASGVDYTGLGSGFTGNVGVGWLLVNGSNRHLVTAVSGSGPYTLTLTSVTGLSAAAYTVHRPIPITVEWQPRLGGNPHELKQWNECQLVAETQDAYKATLTFANEGDYKAEPFAVGWASSPPSHSVYITHSGAQGSATDHDFGLAAGSVYPATDILTHVEATRAKGKQLVVRLEHNVAQSRFSVKSMGLTTRPTGSGKGAR